MFSAFVIAGCLRGVWSEWRARIHLSAMVIVMLAIGTLGPKTRDVALEDISEVAGTGRRTNVLALQ